VPVALKFAPRPSKRSGKAFSVHLHTMIPLVRNLAPTMKSSFSTESAKSGQCAVVNATGKRRSRLNLHARDRTSSADKVNYRKQGAPALRSPIITASKSRSLAE
jgi:hypothetical protein